MTFRSFSGNSIPALSPLSLLLLFRSPTFRPFPGIPFPPLQCPFPPFRPFCGNSIPAPIVSVPSPLAPSSNVPSLPGNSIPAPISSVPSPLAPSPDVPSLPGNSIPASSMSVFLRSVPSAGILFPPPPSPAPYLLTFPDSVRSNRGTNSTSLGIS